jgi:hypothetical protein
MSLPTWFFYGAAEFALCDFFSIQVSMPLIGRGRWRTYGQHFPILNIMQSLNLKLKIYIVFKSWTEKHHFWTVTNILAKIKRWGTNGHLNCFLLVFEGFFLEGLIRIFADFWWVSYGFFVIFSGFLSFFKVTMIMIVMTVGLR